MVKRSSAGQPESAEEKLGNNLHQSVSSCTYTHWDDLTMMSLGDGLFPCNQGDAHPSDIGRQFRLP